MPYPIKNYQIETRDFSEMNHTQKSRVIYIIVNIVAIINNWILRHKTMSHSNLHHFMNKSYNC